MTKQVAIELIKTHWKRSAYHQSINQSINQIIGSLLILNISNFSFPLNANANFSAVPIGVNFPRIYLEMGRFLCYSQKKKKSFLLTMSSLTNASRSIQKGPPRLVAKCFFFFFFFYLPSNLSVSEKMRKKFKTTG